MSLAAYAHSVLDDLCREHPIGYVPKLVWRRFRVTAGKAYFRVGTIGLSSIVLTEEQAVRETLIHEYAHLMAVAKHGLNGAGHGPAWREAMSELGREPKVRHDYEVVRNKRRQVVTYRCLRCGKQIERARRLPKRRHYVHAGCGGDLRLHSVATVTDRTEDA